MTPYELSERAKALVTLSGLSDLIETEIWSTRRRAIEECAKLADRFAQEATGHTEDQSTAEQIANAIRSFSQPKPGKE